MQETQMRPRKKERSWRYYLRLPLLLVKLDLVLLAILLLSRLVLALFPASAAGEAVSTLPPVPTPAPTPTRQVTPETPDWITVDLLEVNEWSRPGTKLDRVNGVVIHYTGNPGTTAEQNRSYFKNLATTHETYASSNFVIGMDGKIILCVPMDEVAYCSNDRNSDTLSIEVCHPDETGQFTQESYDALVRLTQWLIDSYDLEREDILRHYDVIGKECPLWYVDHPEEWEAFLDELSF